MRDYHHDRNWGCRITKDLSFRGMRIVVLENQLLRISVVVDKGTDIIEFLYKPRDIDLMWRSPLGVRDPHRTVVSSSRSDGAFLDHYEGGWQEILPNGGGPATYAGAEFGLHGEVSLIPWEFSVVEDRPERVSVRFVVRTYRTPFLLEKTLELVEHEAVLRISERLVNDGEERLPFMWGHHPGFGRPLLDAGARIQIPATKIVVHAPDYHPNARFESGFEGTWPFVRTKGGAMLDASLVPSADTRSADLVYATGLTAGWAALVNSQLGIGMGLAFPEVVFRSVWLWQIYGGYTGTPWFGRTYNLGIEPWTSFPGSGLNEAIRLGTAAWIEPGEERHVQLAATVFEGVDTVGEIDATGRVTATR